jgi:hypothetical protein
MVAKDLGLSSSILEPGRAHVLLGYELVVDWYLLSNHLVMCQNAAALVLVKGHWGLMARRWGKVEAAVLIVRVAHQSAPAALIVSLLQVLLRASR